jgi:hypothetical protein
MVELVGSTGRLGNKLFEYSFARIIAEHFNYKFIHNLDNKELSENFNLPKVIEGKEFSFPVQIINGIHEFDYNLLNCILEDVSDRRIKINGYFQKYIYYKNYKDKLKTWFYVNNEKFDYPGAIGVHIRKGDYVNSVYDLPDEYFIDILKAETYEKIYLTSDDPSHPTVKRIQNEFKNVELFNGSPYETLENFSCFDKLITCFGTFSWWMGFLSKASKVYMPNKIIGQIDLKVDDEERYTLV